MRAQQLSPAVTESAPLADLGTLQSALAWDLLRLIRTDFSVPKDNYVASVAPVRLDALENYIRGMLATTAEEKVQHYREASRLNPDYAQAWLELGKTYYAQRAYEPAIAALGQVPQSSSARRPRGKFLSRPRRLRAWRLRKIPKAPLSSSPRACLWPRSITTLEWSLPAAARKRPLTISSGRFRTIPATPTITSTWE